MRIDRVTLRGVTRFADEVSIDLAALGEGLIAFAGPNGAGKTTLLEAAFAGLHLEYPSRPGPIAAVCHGKDARIELELHNGQPYRTLVAVDAVLKSPKTEAYLFSADGSPLTDGKVRSYYDAVEALVGSPRLMLSAALSCQSKRGSFLDLSKAERKDLLAEILDTEGLQELAETARAKANAAELHLERLRGQIESTAAELARLRDDQVDVETVRAQLDAATAERDRLQAELDAAREQYAELQRQQAEVEGEIRTAHAQDAALDDLARQAEKIQRRREAAERAHRDRCDNLRAQIASAEAIAGRLTELTDAAAELTGFREQMDAARPELQRLEDAYRTATEAHHAARRRAAEAQAKRQVLGERLEAAKRATGLLGRVPCVMEDQGNLWRPPHGHPDATATVNLANHCPLLADARKGRDQVAEIERQLSEVEDVDASETAAPMEDAAAAVAAIRDRVAMVEGRCRDLERAAGQLEAARSAAATVERCEAEIHAAEAELVRAVVEMADEIQQLSDRVLAGKLELRNAHADIERRSGEILRQITTTAATGQDLRARHAIQQESTRDLERQLVRAEAARDRISDLEDDHERATDAAQAVALDLADWRLLERALGRDGIQALEIDAAGPELSELTSELLHSCFGDRFDVSFITQQARRDGGMKEVFDVSVVDHERGREGSVDTLSGGETTIVSEAVSLALAIYVGRHSGRRFETLFRDETAGALDPDNAARYVQMLRRARTLAGAHQVVYIAQQPEVWEQADAVVWIEGGRAEVRS